MKKRYLLIICLIAFVTTLVVIHCSAKINKPVSKSYIEACSHCHGEKLQGIRNTKLNCSNCHPIYELNSKDVKDSMRKKMDMVTKHKHNTKNMFNPTPSCYICHKNF